MNNTNDIVERQKKNEKLLRELRITRLVVKYNNYMLKLMYKNNETNLESFIVKHSISTNKLERLLKRK